MPRPAGRGGRVPARRGRRRGRRAPLRQPVRTAAARGDQVRGDALVWAVRACHGERARLTAGGWGGVDGREQRVALLKLALDDPGRVCGAGEVQAEAGRV